MKSGITIKTLALIKTIVISSILFSTLSVSAFEQDVSDKVKAAFVFNFIKYIEWPNEENLVDFDIGYYGNDKMYHVELQKMHGIKVKHFSINIIKITSLEQINQLQIIVIDRAQSRSIRNIARQLKAQAILMVSDNAKDKKYTMLNFIESDKNKLGFELNRYQMLNAGLKVSPDILVLGGTELDIANVLKEMDATITISLDEIKEQSTKLEQLKKNVTSREKQLTLQQKELVLQQEKLTLQNSQLDKQDDELKQNKDDFESLQNDYSQITKELDDSRIQLTNNIDSLHNLKNDIQQKEHSIDNFKY